jgi:hypothetical protein
MLVKRIGDWTLEDRLAEGGRPLVVLFFRSDHGKAAIPQDRFQRLADAYPEARFYEVDLLENPSLEARFSITAPPLTLVFVDGVEKGRVPGARLEPALRGLLGPRSGGPGT